MKRQNRIDVYLPFAIAGVPLMVFFYDVVRQESLLRPVSVHLQQGQTASVFVPIESIYDVSIVRVDGKDLDALKMSPPIKVSDIVEISNSDAVLPASVEGRGYGQVIRIVYAYHLYGSHLFKMSMVSTFARREGIHDLDVVCDPRYYHVLPTYVTVWSAIVFVLFLIVGIGNTVKYMFSRTVPSV